MVFRTTVLRTESSSIVELTLGQQSVDHGGLLPCGEHRRPLVGVVGDVAVSADVERLKLPVARTNPVDRFDQVILPVDMTRPRERIILRASVPDC